MAGLQLLPHWHFLKNLILLSNLHLNKFKIIEIIHLFSENNKIKLENNRKRARKPQKTWRLINNTLLKNKRIKGQVSREIKNTLNSAALRVWDSMEAVLSGVTVLNASVREACVEGDIPCKAPRCGDFVQLPLVRLPWEPFSVARSPSTHQGGAECDVWCTIITKMLF